MRFASLLLLVASVPTIAQEARTAPETKLPALGPYEYEVKPKGEAFRKLNPRKAPAPRADAAEEG